MLHLICLLAILLKLKVSQSTIRNSQSAILHFHFTNFASMVLLPRLITMSESSLNSWGRIRYPE